MALFTPSESPAVVVKEIDLTGGVPNVQSTTGATVGNFRWGPVEERTSIANEAELVDVFATPDSSNTVDFHTASYYLRYSSSLQVVRAVDTNAQNAVATTAATYVNSGAIIDGDILSGGEIVNTTYSADSQAALRIVETNFNIANQDIVVKNEINFDAQMSSLGDVTPEFKTIDSDGTPIDLDSAGIPDGNLTFIAKYPGELGNSLKVSICPPGSAFASWDYRTEFDGAPSTSSFASNRGDTNDEVHVAVIDENGAFTGTRGTVLETFPYLSVGRNGLSDDAVANYVKDVINSNSKYVWMLNFDSDYRAAGAGGLITSGANTDHLGAEPGDQLSVADFTFTNGANSGALAANEYLAGFDLFEDKDQVEVDFLIAPGLSGVTAQTTVVNDLVSTAQQTRKDCVVTASPPRDFVVGVSSASDIVNNITDDWVNGSSPPTRSSYLVMDNNYLKVYDKYNDQYIFIPAASSTAGLMAATDLNRAAWFSPAGSRRGQYLGITSIAYTPTKAQRDELYKNSVNPIANIPGQGIILFGDKTGLSRPSAFDRINVRRLFLILERAISRAAQQVLFEFNDEFTRAEFVNIIEPVLREIKGRRGITDFRVVADETNNTPEVIDRNEFIANIFIKPARSINYVTLNFVAVRTGVDFEEVVGTV